ncbi:Glutamyl-tRNA(Gln) amidotransferase subunit C [Aedoeadaptatus ivorii]|uniref:Glutamyl-tRNA(Gln) amidotransferase subunit C n=1 Tax=Aedoeadaptatus ivorii TaxID=54006 RepID=A0A448V1S8_9FIRM|nr:Asp-tRNA(Asn)/Glu-tRNA(Gln) amidotransferase subunit GatC [Peptoniphilus ivorii]MDQ0508963.1 aspartyl-tRNA(Asn)/glutamyl-tRNA(Gln) amidotransferase subunit C [Peptoniphilus ivorii]VEJ35789.1 Glutamyl-tRNA(Gln) amidotransferase subunit C [Peptoniphilus ivorii]
MNREDIQHIAKISMLRFTDEELDGFAEHFTETMDLIDSIKQSPIHCDPTFHTNDLPNRLREDTIRPSLDREAATQNTATEKYGYFEIIKFVE